MKTTDQGSDSSRTAPAGRDQAGDPLPAAPPPAGFRSARGDEARQGTTSHQIRQPSFPSEQDEIITPAPFTGTPVAAPSGGRSVRASPSLRTVAGLGLLISLLSLALSVFLFFKLLAVRQTFSQGLDMAIQAIDNFDGEGFQYEYHFEQMVPVSASIPLEQDLVFPFRGEIPINTTVRVPIDAGILGTFNVEIPINTSVAIDTAVPVRVDQTFEVSTTIPVSMTIPIAIQPNDPAVQGFLNQVRSWLVQLRESY